MKQIGELPDEVLLEIFDFYIISYEGSHILSDEFKKATDAWQTLVHVCRQWRNLVLGSPRRLNLQLFCTHDTPARDTLDIWPALPLIVKCYLDPTSGTDNIIAALGQSNRVCKVVLWNIAGWQLEQVSAAMKVPFPELTDLRLRLWSDGETPPAIPDSFLGGSAPRLRIFSLSGITFPTLPKQLLFANHLSNLK